MSKDPAGNAHWRAPFSVPSTKAKPRVLCDATLLADGTVLVSGGADRLGQGSDSERFGAPTGPLMTVGAGQARGRGARSVTETRP
jgi:hypothetical protein